MRELGVCFVKVSTYYAAMAAAISKIITSSLQLSILVVRPTQAMYGSSPSLLRGQEILCPTAESK